MPLRAPVSIALALVLAVMPFSGSVLGAAAAETETVQTISQKIKGLERKDGLFPLDWDVKNGKMYLEIPETEKDFLLLDQLPYGLGSNDVGLDRGQLGRGRVVHFTRAGNKVLLIAPNLAYRSSAADAAERIAVKESFAESVLWGFKVEAEENGRLLVDATDFFLRDSHGVGERMQAAQQGNYKLDPSRCAITLDNTKNFPRNTEVEAILTFASDGRPRGEYVASVTPDAHSVTLREHTSLIELPEPGYTPRRNDPRSGFFGVEFRDYAVGDIGGLGWRDVRKGGSGNTNVSVGQQPGGSFTEKHIELTGAVIGLPGLLGDHAAGDGIEFYVKEIRVVLVVIIETDDGEPVTGPEHAIAGRQATAELLVPLNIAGKVHFEDKDVGGGSAGGIQGACKVDVAGLVLFQVVHIHASSILMP